MQHEIGTYIKSKVSELTETPGYEKFNSPCQGKSGEFLAKQHRWPTPESVCVSSETEQRAIGEDDKSAGKIIEALLPDITSVYCEALTSLFNFPHWAN